MYRAVSVKLSKRQQEEFNQLDALIQRLGGRLEPMRAMRPIIERREPLAPQQEAK